MSVSLEALAMAGLDSSELDMDIEEWERREFENPAPPHLLAEEEDDDDEEEEEDKDKDLSDQGFFFIRPTVSRRNEGDEDDDWRSINGGLDVCFRRNLGGRISLSCFTSSKIRVTSGMQKSLETLSAESRTT